MRSLLLPSVLTSWAAAQLERCAAILHLSLPLFNAGISLDVARSAFLISTTGRLHGILAIIKCVLLAFALILEFESSQTCMRHSTVTKTWHYLQRWLPWLVGMYFFTKYVILGYPLPRTGTVIGVLIDWLPPSLDRPAPMVHVTYSYLDVLHDCPCCIHHSVSSN